MWGRNDQQGTLGQNDLTQRSSPVQVGTNDVWSSVSQFQYSVASIKADGTLWGWGRNQSGQLGQNESSGSPSKFSSPVQIGGNTNWSKLNQTKSNNTTTFLSIKTDGTLWSWGQNDKGMMGINIAEGTEYSSPTQVGTDTTWDQISASGNTAVSIKTDGTLWVWGQNGNYGPFGNNNRGQEFSSPVQIGTNTNWEYVEMSGYNGLGWHGIKTDGTLWGTGYNYYGTIGNNTAYWNSGGNNGYSSPVQIPGTTWSKTSSSVNATFGVKTDGTLWAWGDNEFGELGMNTAGHPQMRSSPIQIPGTTWSDVNAGTFYNVQALKTDGTLWSWGYQAFGQLGLNNGGPAQNRSSPTQIPGTWVVAGGNAQFGAAAIRQP